MTEPNLNPATDKPWPLVLVIDRKINCEPFSPHLHWTDSCGNRSVWFYNETGHDYKSATDLPEELFDTITLCLKKLKIKTDILLRIEDPGLGIFIEPIDRPAFEAIA